jgi:hypothetical protein
MNKEQIEKIFDDEELNKIDPNLSLLPYDLKRDIYEKYFYPNRLVLDLLEELQSKDCRQLNIINLVPILRNILQDELAVDYLLENYLYICSYSGYKTNYFKQLYNEIIVNKVKYFVLIDDPIEDFALSWIFYMYK